MQFLQLELEFCFRVFWMDLNHTTLNRSWFLDPDAHLLWGAFDALAADDDLRLCLMHSQGAERRAQQKNCEKNHDECLAGGKCLTIDTINDLGRWLFFCKEIRDNGAMLLASSWSSRRQSSWPAQLELAGTLGFRGLALLDDEASGQERPEIPAPNRLQKPQGSEMGVLDANLLAAADGTPATAESLVQALRGFTCGHLLLSAGVDPDASRAARAQALLDRVYQGETLDSQDEALEEFQQQDLARQEQQLEDLLRRIAAIRKLAPGLSISLRVLASPAGLLTLQTMEMLLEEAKRYEIGYWHDVGATATRQLAGGEEAAAWLDRFASCCLGATLEDCHQGLGGQPPGTGVVDWQLLAEYLPSAAVKALRLAPSYPGMVVEEARTSLHALNLR